MLFPSLTYVTFIRFAAHWAIDLLDQLGCSEEHRAACIEIVRACYAEADFDFQEIGLDECREWLEEVVLPLVVELDTYDWNQG